MSNVSMINGHIDKHEETERDRLIELLLSKSCMTNECPDVDCEKCELIAVHTGDADKIADYLLSNGVIVPPCKVGQTVYRVVTMGTGVTFKKVGFNTYREKKQTIKHFIRCVTVTKNNFFDVCENWGISVFATKEEALSKLQASCKQVKGEEI